MTATTPPKSRVERVNARIRQNPIVATAIVVGTLVIGVASFTDATTKIVALFTKQSPAAARTALGQLSLPFTADAFVASASSGDETAVKLFLTAGMDPNATAADGSTAVASAAFYGHASLVTFLLDSGAHLVDDGGDRSALYSAIAGRQEAIVRQLLDRHPGQDAIDAAFVVAIRRRNTTPVRDLEAMRVLAAAGANVRKMAPAAFAALWENAYDDDAADGAKVLLDLGAVLADFDGTNGETTTMTPLITAAASHFPATADLLLARGARLETRYRHPDADDDGATALMFAVDSGSADIVAALLAKGADVGARDRQGLRAIDHAKRSGRTGMTEVLQILQKASHRSG